MRTLALLLSPLVALALAGAPSPAVASPDALDALGWRAMSQVQAPAASAATYRHASRWRQPSRWRQASRWRKAGRWTRTSARWRASRWTPTRRWVGRVGDGVVIRLSQQRLYWAGFAFPISTGKHYSTPRGSFRVVSKVHRPSWTYKGKHVPGGTAANPLGACWLGLSLPWGWRGAPIGIHGTNAPWLIGAPVSRGCIRMHNRDALWLLRTVPVGTAVTIVP